MRRPLLQYALEPVCDTALTLRHTDSSRLSDDVEDLSVEYLRPPQSVLLQRVNYVCPAIPPFMTVRADLDQIECNN